MARSLTAQQNTLKLWDNISNSHLVLYYREPTIKERQQYQNSMIRRHRGKVRFRQVETRVDFGLRIITGFREGDFTREKKGKAVPLSSDTASKHFCEDWKEQLKQSAADVIMILAAHVFESPTEVDGEEYENVEGE